MHLVGIDLGGTKIEGVVVDSENLTQPLCRLRVPTEADLGYEHILGQIAKLLDMLREHLEKDKPIRLGMGTPGSLDPMTGILKGSNTQCLNHKPLREDLEKILGEKIIMANDANCFALAESCMGSCRGYETVFGIIMGTGCGGGVVIGDRVLSGCHGIAGEWGQIVLDPQGPVSKYGTRGTVESYLSGPAIEAWYFEQSGQRLKLQEIAKKAIEGTDAIASQTIDRLTDSFAQSINIILNVFDPHAIVIGGGVGNVAALYGEATRKKIEARMFVPPFKTALLQPSLGDSAGVFGAAMLARP